MAHWAMSSLVSARLPGRVRPFYLGAFPAARSAARSIGPILGGTHEDISTFAALLDRTCRTGMDLHPADGAGVRRARRLPAQRPDHDRLGARRRHGHRAARAREQAGGAEAARLRREPGRGQAQGGEPDRPRPAHAGDGLQGTADRRRRRARDHHHHPRDRAAGDRDHEADEQGDRGPLMWSVAVALVLAAPAAATAFHLAVPVVRQAPERCGPAALEMVLRFYGADSSVGLAEAAYDPVLHGALITDLANA